MMELGFKLNASKTVCSSDIIGLSIKPANLERIKIITHRNLQKQLLMYYQFAKHHPNDGQLKNILNSFAKKVSKRKKISGVEPLVAIVTELAVKNPCCYPPCASILSSLLCHVKDKEARQQLFDKVKNKISATPNSSKMLVWLQRVAIGIDVRGEFDEPICRIVEGEAVALWNIQWVADSKIAKLVDTSLVIDKLELEAVTCEFDVDEFDIFEY